MCMTCASQAPAMTSSLSALAPYGVAATAAAGSLLLRRPRRSSDRAQPADTPSAEATDSPPATSGRDDDPSQVADD
jgi:hypothetical protein